MRFSIVAELAEMDESEFGHVRDTVEVSDSVLSKQSTQLEKGRLREGRKGYVGKRHRTWLSLTSAGRAAYAATWPRCAPSPATYPEPAPDADAGAEAAVPADYSEAELEDAMAELNAAFGTLAEEQSVHALGVHLQRNRVVLKAADPGEVDFTPYTSEGSAEMAVVEGGVPPTTLASEDAADGECSGAAVVLFAGAGLLLLGPGGFWYARRRQGRRLSAAAWRRTQSRRSLSARYDVHVPFVQRS